MQNISLEKYINSPSPIKDELRILFSKNKPLVIFDIGSCEGEDSIKYSRLFPNSKVFAFEALPKNQKAIGENLKKYSSMNVVLFPIALSDKKGISNFYISSGQPPHDKNNSSWDYGNKSSSLLEPGDKYKKHPWLNFDEIIEVETDTLKNICDKNQIKVVDFIHIDVQGAELKVLKGAENNIRKIKAIWLEVEKISLYKNQPLNCDVENFFERNNFLKIKDTVGNISGDQLYINKEYFNEFQIEMIKLLHIIQKTNTFISIPYVFLKRVLLKIRSELVSQK